MSRASSRLSQRYGRPDSRLKRPKSAAPYLYPPDPYHVVFEDEEEVGESSGPPFPRPHTSFHYYPEELEEEGGVVGEPQMVEKGDLYGQGYDQNDDDYNHHHHHHHHRHQHQAWGNLSEENDPAPLKLAKTHGFGYRKRDKELTPHWSQWPQTPPSEKAPQHTAVPPHTTARPRTPCLAKKRPTAQSTVYEPALYRNPYQAAMAYRNRYSDERNIIMHRGLSPRRAAPPTMPGRSMTQYGSFGNRDYIGSLDLSAPPQYNAYRGYNIPDTSRSGSRESRPMHRHMRPAKQDEGYLHNNSIYYSTTPNVSGYFIIHPDWVSERLSMRRSQSLLSF